MKFVDLFCGIGSFHHSFSDDDECVYACDINEDVRKVYNHNYNFKPDGDILNLDIGNLKDFDCLCAGFPCQPFSNIGKRLGMDDERGSLIYQIAKILKIKKPRYFILENVRGLINHNDGKTFNKMLDILSECGFNINHKILKCEEFGIPQKRRRLFIVGDRNCHPKMDYIKSKKITLSDFFNKNFERDYAFTIRCGGLGSPINDRRNWDGYIVDGKEYRLTVNDMLKLQGFPRDFKFNCSTTAAKKMLGNTIPTNLSKIVIEGLKNA